MDFKERYTYDTETDLLGRGGFARVYKAFDVLLERYVAVKVFTTHDKDKYNVLEEIKKAIRLEHPSLLRYYDVATVEGVNSFREKEVLQIGVMELANYGDLKTFTSGYYSQELLNELLIQVLEGMTYLHRKGIIHRDLKPQNILLIEDNGVVCAKISDFGISKNLNSSGTSSSTSVGTIEYMAPEQFNPGKYGLNGKIGTNVDLWAFGIMVFELIMKHSLFGSRGHDTTAEQIMSNILAPQLPVQIEEMPEPYRTIVKKCLVTDASKRITNASELIPYFKSAASLPTPTMEYKFPLKGDSPPPVQERQVETLIMPKKEADVEDEKPAQAAPKKRRPSVLMPLLFLGVLALAGLGYFYYSPKKAIAENPAALYADGMKDYGKENTLFLQELTRASTLGYDSANLALSAYYDEKGQTDSAINWLQPLAAKNNLKAIEKMAGLWEKTTGASKGDSSTAYYRKCAGLGSPSCEYQLGMLYYNGGPGTDKNLQTAFGCFKKAADAGNAPAQCMLGNMFYAGEGVSERDNAEALEWYMKSAEQGNEVATYALGLFYADGIGVQKSTTEAKKYLERAISGNNPDVKKAAENKLRQLR